MVPRLLQNDAATAALLGVIWSKNLPGLFAVHPETIAVILPNVRDFGDGNSAKNVILVKDNKQNYLWFIVIVKQVRNEKKLLYII